ncbi:MAG: ABC transporter permease [Caldilineaceae bacterium]|nr:ABC transporter permease [Caldilineaceae bacterium]
MSKSLQLAWRNMWRNWRRTSIALTAIVLGLALLLFFDGIIQSTDQAMFGNAVRLYGGNIQIHAPGYREKAHRLPLLPLDDADAVVQTILTQPPEVAASGVRLADAQSPIIAAAKRINTAGLITNREGSFSVSITAIQPDVEAPFSLQAENIIAGRFLEPGDGDVILIGKGLADLMEIGVDDRVTLLGKSKNETMRQRTMTVIGIYDLNMQEAEQGMVYMSLAEAQSLYNLRGEATEVSITLSQTGREDEIVPRLKSELPGYEVDSWATLRPEIREAMESKAAFTSIFGFIVLFIAAIGILNLMLMAVFERTREMGVLAALGMKGRQLMGLFVLEGSLIGLLGAILGGALGMGLMALINQMGGIDLSYTQGMGEMTALMGDRLYPSITLTNVINRGVAVIFITALASLYPAWQAVHREPAQALHYV